ncbi:MBL fold metallo-hydrolase [bacterium]|nr:MBL fold metallo-hydrolase [bacterium]MBU1984823.1 MBL fold metallo-hydrolase [bacterium]
MISRTLPISFLFLATLALAALPDPKWTASDELTVAKLDEDVYVVVHEREWPYNSLIVMMPDSMLVLVDTPTTPEATRDLLEWCRENLHYARAIAVNTHFHVDCLGGNAALREMNVPAYGSEMTVQLLAERQAEIRAVMANVESDSVELAEVDTSILAHLPPDHVFPADSGLVLTFGGDSVIFYYPGPAHTRDNIVVWFPAQKALFGGCMIRGGNSLGNLADADTVHWAESVRKLKRFPARFVVSGHSLIFTPDLIENTLRLFH